MSDDTENAFEGWAILELDTDEIGRVHRRLADCQDRDDVVALLVAIADSKGQDASGEPESEQPGE